MRHLTKIGLNSDSKIFEAANFDARSMSKLLSKIRLKLALSGVLIASIAMNSIAIEVPKPVDAPSQSTAPDIDAWLLRVHEASKRRNYAGTFVVSANGEIASSRIWQVCDGQTQLQRIEKLTGESQITYRRNNEVVTFYPNRKVVQIESSDALGAYPDLLKTIPKTISEYYQFTRVGAQRIAGVDTNIAEIKAKDPYRFSYRVWTAKDSGLVVKMQTLDAQARVLEESVFSELDLNAPIQMDQLLKQMQQTDGFKKEYVTLVKTTPEAQGWMIKEGAPLGFAATACYQRSNQGANKTKFWQKLFKTHGSTMQWQFSDGLANVSLFIGHYDVKDGLTDSRHSAGATQILRKRLDRFWLTLVGDVPQVTLELFAQKLQRKSD
jgi:sigma-E factor negative regulatory protein RseB